MSFKVVGIKTRTTNQAALVDVEELWQKYEQVKDKLPGRAREIIVVYSNYENEMMGEYDYMIGREMPSDFQVPEGMVVTEVPDKSKMTHFEARGEMPDALMQKWGEIWSDENLERAFEVDYEVYPLSDQKLAHVYIGEKKSA